MSLQQIAEMVRFIQDVRNQAVPGVEFLRFDHLRAIALHPRWVSRPIFRVKARTRHVSYLERYYDL